MPATLKNKCQRPKNRCQLCRVAASGLELAPAGKCKCQHRRTKVTHKRTHKKKQGLVPIFGSDGRTYQGWLDPLSTCVASGRVLLLLRRHVYSTPRFGLIVVACGRSRAQKPKLRDTRCQTHKRQHKLRTRTRVLGVGKALRTRYVRQ